MNRLILQYFEVVIVVCHVNQGTRYKKSADEDELL